MKAFYMLCVSRVGTCLGTMMFAGALPVIRDEWLIDATSAGSIQTIFSISNAIALFVASWLSDYLGARRVYLWFSWLGVAALLLMAIFARSYHSVLLMMALVGLTQGGAYTPALLLAMGMNSVRRRGYALGMMLASGSLGYLLSVFISAWGAMSWGASAAFWLCMMGAFAGAVSGSVALSGYRQTEQVGLSVSGGRKSRKDGSLSITAIILLVGYIGHCWELLGSWAWTPGLVTESLGAFDLPPLFTGLIVAAVVHLSGMFAMLLVGTISDYFTRFTILIVMGAAGALSSLLIGWSVSWGAGWVLLIVFVGSFFILGDSGVLSAAIADNVPPQHLGSVLGIRSLLGFGVGSLAPLSVGITLDSTHQWSLSYAVLAMGGVVACFSACLLRRQSFDSE